MKTYETIQFEITGDIATVWMNRPDIHNAFNELMIGELLDAFTQVNEMDAVRVVALRGRGKSFCAGADLNWMRGVAGYSLRAKLQ
jgi:methylglutaconyl-CoA hydratase